MTFSNPIWLWGFMGLTVPIAIHFLSRKESKVIRLGSLRHLQDSITNQSVNIRLNEILLLLIRCLLIIVTVLLLSGLGLKNNEASQKWLLVESGVEQEQFARVIDSLKKQGFVARQFVNGFPDINEQQKDSSVNYWSLAEQLGLKHSGQTVVISKNRIAGFTGKRIPLPGNVTWLASDSDSSNFDLAINNNKADSLVVRTAHSNAHLTSYSNEDKNTAGTSSKAPALDKISVTIASDKKYNFDKDVIIAALHAIDHNSVISIDIRTILPSEYTSSDSADWVVWLSDENMTTVNSNIIRVDTTDQTDNMPLIVQGSCQNKRCWKIVRRLRIETALRGRLVLELAEVLLNNAKKSLQLQTKVNDKRALPEQLVWSSTQGSKSVASKDQSNHAEIAIPLVILIMMLLIGERWLSLKRNQ